MQQHVQTSVKSTSSPGDAETDDKTKSHAVTSGFGKLSHSQLLRPLFLKNIYQTGLSADPKSRSVNECVQ